MKKLLTAILLTTIFTNLLFSEEKCSCKTHGRPYNPENECCGETEFTPKEVDYTFSPNFDAIKSSFDCFNAVQRSLCNTSGTIYFSPAISISCNGKYTCCEKKDVILLGNISASGGLHVSVPAIRSGNLPIPGTWGIVYFSTTIGFAAQLSFSGTMQSTCARPQGVFALTGEISATGGGSLKAISDNIASLSGSISSSGNCAITYTLKSGEKSGTWNVKQCSISKVEAAYTVIVAGFQASKGTINLL